jgi:hypothetical protein
MPTVDDTDNEYPTPGSPGSSSGGGGGSTTEDETLDSEGGGVSTTDEAEPGSSTIDEPGAPDDVESPSTGMPKGPRRSDLKPAQPSKTVSLPAEDDDDATLDGAADDPSLPADDEGVLPVRPSATARSSSRPRPNTPSRGGAGAADAYGEDDTTPAATEDESEADASATTTTTGGSSSRGAKKNKNAGKHGAKHGSGALASEADALGEAEAMPTKKSPIVESQDTSGERNWGPGAQQGGGAPLVTGAAPGPLQGGASLGTCAAPGPMAGTMPSSGAAIGPRSMSADEIAGEDTLAEASDETVDQMASDMGAE